MSSDPKDSNEPDDQPSNVPLSIVTAVPVFSSALLQHSTQEGVSAEESIVQPGVLIGEPLPQLEGTLSATERRGGGGYSDVYQGTWTHEEGEIAVAIKRLRKEGIVQGDDPITAQARFERRIRRETTIWRQATHPNILPFIGYQIHDGEPMLVSPWCQNGSLGEYLRNNWQLTDLEKLRLLKDVARGLAYLHSRVPPIAHGDIKPENVMIQDDRSAAITDFGVSRVMTDLGIHTGFTTEASAPGTVGFQAEELFEEGTRPTNMSDVYAFGGLILSTMTGNCPFYRQRTAAAVMLSIFHGETPRPEDHPQLPQNDPLWNLMRECWSRQPDQRPSMDRIIQVLEAQIQIRSPPPVSYLSLHSTL